MWYVIETLLERRKRDEFDKPLVAARRVRHITMDNPTGAPTTRTYCGRVAPRWDAQARSLVNPDVAGEECAECEKVRRRMVSIASRHTLYP